MSLCDWSSDVCSSDLSLALRLKGSSVGRILENDFHYHPHKIQVTQVLSERDKVSRQQYCYEFLDLVNNSRDTGNALLMSEEALPYVWLCESTELSVSGCKQHTLTSPASSV
jgi:hypothetical protein